MARDTDACKRPELPRRWQNASPAGIFLKAVSPFAHPHNAPVCLFVTFAFRFQMQAENLAPHVVASLARQLRQLATTPPDGISFVPSEALHEIFADVDGPSTYFTLLPSTCLNK